MVDIAAPEESLASRTLAAGPALSRRGDCSGLFDRTAVHPRLQHPVGLALRSESADRNHRPVERDDACLQVQMAHSYFIKD
jgi:hypothetical protein